MKLLDPIRIGSRTAPNRVFFGPHVTNLGRGRAFSDRHTAYYARRAAGGCGVVVTETASVHPSDWPYERAPLASECEAGWRAVAEACHRHGAIVVASLGHAGMQGSSAYSQRELWAPSPIAAVVSRELPKEMESDDIAAVVAGFAAAARAATRAGLDGVEVNAGQHSLVRQFASGLTNNRADAYGVDRLRFVREVLAAARQGVGTGLVGLRLCVDELAPWAGITPESAVDVATALAPLVDYLVCVRGSIYSVDATRPDGHTEPGFGLPVAARVRAALGGAVPVVAQGSIVDVPLAERALGEGSADAVEMTRALLADADLVRKVAGGRAGDVRPCMLCNQSCQVLDVRNMLVSCAVDPSTGHETDDPDPEHHREAVQALDFLVVGGGPAGLEAARVAALHGHRVRLVESRPRLGGRVRHAAAAPGRARLAVFTDWLEEQCRRLGVVVETGRPATADDVRTHAGPVVVCTGSVDGRRDYDVAAGVRVLSADALLADVASDSRLPDGPAVVWDPVGGPVGVSVAELLADRGDVTLVHPDQVAGVQLARTGDLVAASGRLARAGVTVVPRSRLRAVTAGGAVVEELFGGGTSTIAATFVVDAGFRLPDAGPPVERPGMVSAGDAVAPRTVYEAVLEGRRAVYAGERAGEPLAVP